MNTTTLACYFETIAGLLRQTRSTDLPLASVITERGKSILRMDLYGKTFGPVPIPPHADCRAFLSVCFPELPHGGEPVATAVDRSEVESLTRELAQARASYERAASDAIERARMVTEYARELESLRRTIDRMRPAVTVTPAPAPAPAPAPIDYLSMVMGQTAPLPLPTIRPSFAVLPVCISFAPGHQGRVIEKAGLTLEDLRTCFRWVFFDPKTPQKGGVWRAADPTAPITHLLVERLTTAGATVHQTIPTPA